LCYARDCLNQYRRDVLLFQIRIRNTFYLLNLSEVNIINL